MSRSSVVVLLFVVLPAKLVCCVQLSDQAARADYENRVQIAQQSARGLASELEAAKAELSIAQVWCPAK
jgi:hypothetical protein